MATNLCAECGTRLPRPEYKTHMQQVHGVSVMNDSDEEHTEMAPASAEDQAPAGDEAPRSQRPRRGGRTKPAGEAGDDAAGADGADAPPSGGGRRRGGRRPAPEDGKGDGEFACTECDRAFATDQGRMRHVQAKHPDPAAAAAAAAAGPVRRGGRPGPGAADGSAENGGDASRSARNNPRRRPAARPAAPITEDSAEGAAAAAAAAAAALGGSPGPSEAREPRPDRQVTLLRCKLCEQGFKSKNRARAHVKEAHPDAVPAAISEPAAEGDEAHDDAAHDRPEPADELLEVVQVPARRAPRSSARRRNAGGRAPAANGDAVSADGAPRPATGVRRGGRPPKAQATGDGEPAAEPTDELAALGIVSAS